MQTMTARRRNTKQVPDLGRTASRPAGVRAVRPAQRSRLPKPENGRPPEASDQRWRRRSRKPLRGRTAHQRLQSRLDFRADAGLRPLREPDLVVADPVLEMNCSIVVSAGRRHVIVKSRMRTPHGCGMSPGRSRRRADHQCLAAREVDNSGSLKTQCGRQDRPRVRA